MIDVFCVSSELLRLPDPKKAPTPIKSGLESGHVTTWPPHLAYNVKLPIITKEYTSIAFKAPDGRNPALHSHASKGPLPRVGYKHTGARCSAVDVTAQETNPAHNQGLEISSHFSRRFHACMFQMIAISTHKPLREQVKRRHGMDEGFAIARTHLSADHSNSGLGQTNV